MCKEQTAALASSFQQAALQESLCLKQEVVFRLEPGASPVERKGFICVLMVSF